MPLPYATVTHGMASWTLPFPYENLATNKQTTQMIFTVKSIFFQGYFPESKRQYVMEFQKVAITWGGIHG